MNIVQPTPPQNALATNTHNLGFYRVNQVAQLLCVSKSTFWLWSQQGTVQGIKVPKSIKLSPGVTVWLRSEIHAFCEQLAALGESNTPPEAD
jgi:predicted DNA-binding transcriptional regulator AlpA